MPVDQAVAHVTCPACGSRRRKKCTRWSQVHHSRQPHRTHDSRVNEWIDTLAQRAVKEGFARGMKMARQRSPKK